MTSTHAWTEIKLLPSKSYVCGYCGNPLASEKGWSALEHALGKHNWFIYVCHYCDRPTFFDNAGHQTPGAIFGNPVKDIPDQLVSELYDEARRATSVNSYTAAVLSCRKLLMHVAVSKGAKHGEDFLYYVQYLADHHFIPPDAKGWVDQIRTKGNEANHQIKIMTKEDAEELISFVEMLLKVIYEFPARVKPKSPT